MSIKEATSAAAWRRAENRALALLFFSFSTSLVFYSSTLFPSRLLKPFIFKQEQSIEKNEFPIYIFKVEEQATENGKNYSHLLTLYSILTAYYFIEKLYISTYYSIKKFFNRTKGTLPLNSLKNYKNIQGDFDFNALLFVQ